MSYGALLTDEQGVPFYIDGTRPLTLISKIAVSIPSSSGVFSRDLYANDGQVRFVFIQSNSSDGAKAEWLQMESGVWRLYASGGSRTVTVYIFGYANQPVPAWGIAIWDANGNCILTNESKVLKDVVQLGDISSDSTSGYRISNTRSGSWAIAPTYTGVFNGVDNSTGQPRPVVNTYYASAYYNGSSTVISSHTNGSLAGTTGGTYTNARNTITAVNVANY